MISPAETFPRQFIFRLVFFDEALFVRFHSAEHAVKVYQGGREEHFYGNLSSVVGQCETGHWKEITEREAMNLGNQYMQLPR